jgi:hypothetical protein
LNPPDYETTKNAHKKNEEQNRGRRKGRRGRGGRRKRKKNLVFWFMSPMDISTGPFLAS